MILNAGTQKYMYSVALKAIEKQRFAEPFSKSASPRPLRLCVKRFFFPLAGVFQASRDAVDAQ